LTRTLNDPSLIPKVSEQSPKDLDSALKFAVQLEAQTNDADLTKQELQTKDQRPKDREVDNGLHKDAIIAKAKQAVELRAH